MSRHHLVPFTLANVCFALGLQIYGKLVSLHDDGECQVKHLFEGEHITVKNIVKRLNQKRMKKVKYVHEFCRLYILLAFVVFYFPKTFSIVNSVPFTLLDDLEILFDYN